MMNTIGIETKVLSIAITLKNEDDVRILQRCIASGKAGEYILAAVMEAIADLMSPPEVMRLIEVINRVSLDAKVKLIP